MSQYAHLRQKRLENKRPGSFEILQERRRQEENDKRE